MERLARTAEEMTKIRKDFSSSLLSQTASKASFQEFWWPRDAMAVRPDLEQNVAIFKNVKFCVTL